MRFAHVFSLLIFAWPLVFTAEVSKAEARRYISDVLHVNLLSGKGQGERLKLLKSNEPVDIVEESDGFTRVRTEDGTVGWIASRFVTDLQPKVQTIHELQRRLAEAEVRLIALASPMAVKTDDSAPSSEPSVLKSPGESSGNTELARQYDELLKKSRRAVELVEHHEALKESFEKLSRERDAMQDEVKQLRTQSSIIWFLCGAGVFGTGWVAGKLSRRRKQFNL